MPSDDQAAAARRRKRHELSNMVSKVVFNTMFGLLIIVSLYIGPGALLGHGFTVGSGG